eukprot:m.212702 g.212702  ORF g.212702 m.212702 type:complete len:113 (+) comp21178_c0_seq1:95-433(+)
MPNLFLSLKREKTTVFLEVDAAERVRSVVEQVAKLMQKPADDVALFFNGQRLSEGKTFSENGIQHDRPNVVEPISLHFVFKKADADDWEEPNATPTSLPPPVNENLEQEDEN